MIACNCLMDCMPVACRGYVIFGSTLQGYGEVGGALSTLIACADFGSPLIASDAILMQL